MVSLCGFDLERDSILKSHNFLYDFIDNIVDLNEKRDDVAAEKIVIREKTEIVALLSSLMVDRARLTISSSDVKGGYSFQNNIILDVSDGLFTITDNSVSYQDRSFPVNISILIDTLDRRYVFNCTNMSKSDNGLKVNLSIPKSIIYLNRKNNPITQVDFVESSALLTWQGMGTMFSGDIKNISKHSIWIDYDRIFFNDSFYSIISGSIMNGNPIILPLTIDIIGIQKTVLVKVVEAVSTSDGYSFVFDFITAKEGDLTNETINRVKECKYLTVLGSSFVYFVDTSKSGAISLIPKSDEEIDLSYVNLLNTLNDGDEVIGSISGKYFLLKFYSKGSPNKFDLVCSIGEDIKISNKPTSDLIELIDIVKDKSEKYAIVKTSISVIN